MTVVHIYKGGIPLLSSTYERPGCSFIKLCIGFFRQMIIWFIKPFKKRNASSLRVLTAHCSFGCFWLHGSSLIWTEWQWRKGGMVGPSSLTCRKHLEQWNTQSHKINSWTSTSLRLSQHYQILILISSSYFVRINNRNSKTLQLSTGVPQGSVLSAVPFSKYISDLPSVCERHDTRGGLVTAWLKWKKRKSPICSLIFWKYFFC